MTYIWGFVLINNEFEQNTFIVFKTDSLHSKYDILYVDHI